MKRVLMIIALSLFMFGNTESVFAQLKEVKGVETKWVSRKDDDGNDRYNREFINRNPFSVTVEAEWWTWDWLDHPSRKTENYIAGTKEFILGPSGSYNESYEWKLLLYSHCHNRSYVKYKAYKNEE